jgi:hypothetical protein
MAGAMSGALPACCTNFSCVPTPRNCRAVRWRTQWPRNGWLGAPNARAKVGWDLILEYLFGACSVAVGWSGYVSLLLNDFGIHLRTAPVTLLLRRLKRVLFPVTYDVGNHLVSDPECRFETG